MNSIENIVKSNTETYKSKKYLFIENKSSDRLLIILSPHNQGENFSWKKYLIYNEVANLLYLNNPDDNYYDYCDNHKEYVEIIRHYISKFYRKDCFIMGSSMSGTVAIRIGIELDLNVISFAPQVSFNETVEFATVSFPNNPKVKLIGDIRKIKESGCWVDLDKYISSNQKHIPPIYLSFNHLRFDTRNAYNLINSLMKVANGKMIVNHSESSSHGFSIFSKEDAISLVNIMNILSIFRENKFSWEYR